MGSTTRGVFFFMSFFVLKNRKRGDGMKVNGTEIVLAEGTTLLLYLQQGYKLERIAVEYNGAIVAREQYTSVVLRPTDVLEIVSFVGGG